MGVAHSPGRSSSATFPLEGNNKSFAQARESQSFSLRFAFLPLWIIIFLATDVRQFFSA